MYLHCRHRSNIDTVIADYLFISYLLARAAQLPDAPALLLRSPARTPAAIRRDCSAGSPHQCQMLAQSRQKLA